MLYKTILDSNKTRTSGLTESKVLVIFLIFYQLSVPFIGNNINSNKKVFKVFMI